MNPEIQELESILGTLLQVVQETLQSGEVLTDEIQDQIAQVITGLTTEIQNLSQAQDQQGEGGIQTPPSEPPTPPPSGPSIPTGGPIPELEQAPHESSNINSFRYDPQSRQLYVKFQGRYPQQNGPIYSYNGVPPFIYDVFRRGSLAPRTSGRNAWHTWREGVTPSHGAAMYALIRSGGYPYQRIS